MKKTVRESVGSNHGTTYSARDTSSANSHRQDAGSGILLTLGGGITLGGLFTLCNYVKLDKLLLVSQAIFNVIGGVNGIFLGICRLLLGIAQMVGITTLAVIAVVSVLAVSSGSIRLCLKLLPQLASTWNFLASVLNGFIKLLSLPQSHSQRRSALNKNSKLQSAFDMPNANHVSANRAA